MNPGTLALLRRLGMADRLETRGLPVAGMILTGADGVEVETRYPKGLQGRALVRRELDWSLLQQATAAGAEFEPWTTVRRAELDSGVSGVAVKGVSVRSTVSAMSRQVNVSDSLGLSTSGSRPASVSTWKPLHTPSTSPPSPAKCVTAAMIGENRAIAPQRR